MEMNSSGFASFSTTNVRPENINMPMITTKPKRPNSLYESLRVAPRVWRPVMWRPSRNILKIRIIRKTWAILRISSRYSPELKVKVVKLSIYHPVNGGSSIILCGYVERARLVNSIYFFHLKHLATSTFSCWKEREKQSKERCLANQSHSFPLW